MKTTTFQTTKNSRLRSSSLPPISKSRGYAIHTLGCKANLNDSQVLESALQAKGFQSLSDDELVSICIVNSCTVTDEADRNSRKSAERLARKYPNAKIVYTGCSAEVDPEAYVDVPGIDYIVGNQDKSHLVDWVVDRLDARSEKCGEFEVEPNTNYRAQVLGSVTGYNEILSRHPEDREWPMPASVWERPVSDRAERSRNTSVRTRAFFKIQEGCDSFCTFCIIPYGRGPSRSLDPKEVLKQIKALIDQGVKEVVLTGTNLGNYGRDPSALDECIQLILEDTPLERLRVSSLDPTEVTPRTIELMKEFKAFCPHFHISLQSPSTKILRLMKRRYAFEEVKASLEKIDSIGAFVGMDLITGFPGETEEDFEWTVNALAALPWQKLHVFPYSERKGTPATRIPRVVPVAERRRRTRVLNALSLERLERHYHQKKCTSLKQVLFEGIALGPDGTRNWISGYSPEYLRVLVPRAGRSRSEYQNQVCDVELSGVFRDRDQGEVGYTGQLNH